MPLDSATYLLHTAEAEKTIIYLHGPDDEDNEVHACPALLIAQTKYRKLFITLETPRRYLAHTQVPGEEEVEIEFLDDYEEVEALLEDAGLDGIHDGEQGVLYHNLLYLLMNP